MRKTTILVIGLLVAIAFAMNRSGTPTTPSFMSTPSPTPLPTLAPPPSTKVLQNSYHIFQSFNNCGPAALSMALSYYGITKSQAELGNDLRPYQNPQGDNDDKSVTLAELAEKSKEYGFIPFHRPNGSIPIMKQFIAHDMPVITRTWLKPDEDIGHYRVVKGYNPTGLIQDDSLQGKNLTYSFNDFNAIWKKFNYEYLVLVPKEKEELARAILQEDFDEKKAWEKALHSAQGELQENENDVYARFNLSVAYFHSGDYQKSVAEFEKVQNRLSFRTLWYQIEPILAYYELGDYDNVLAITDKILNNQNRAFSELYLIRGEIYKKQGNSDAARNEFEKAVLYNKNLQKAHDALNNI